jgi:hypothetical protein
MAGRRSWTTPTLPLQQFSPSVSRTFSPSVSLSVSLYVRFGFPIKSTQQEHERVASTFFSPSGFPHDFLFYFQVLPSFELLLTFGLNFNCGCGLRKFINAWEGARIRRSTWPFSSVCPRYRCNSSTSWQEIRSGLYVVGWSVRFMVLS